MIATPPVKVENILALWDAPSFFLTQLVTGTSRNTDYQAHFEIEWQNGTLTLVALTPSGIPLFTLKATSAGTELQSFAPPADEQTLLDPEWILSDFLLATAPLDILQQSLSDPALRITENTAHNRLLQRGKRLAVRIIYSGHPLLADQITLNNVELGYQIVVKTLLRGELKP